MRFVGRIPAQVRNLLYNELKHLKGEKIQIIASGSFTLEQVLQDVTEDIYSNDVALLSVAFGDFLTGSDRELKITNTDLLPLEKYLNQSALDNAGIVLTAYAIGEFALRNNFTHLRKFNYIMANIDKVFTDNKEYIAERFKGVKIKELYVEDAIDVIERTDDKKIVSFLPTYTGGYEKLYGYLDGAVGWKEPSYQIIDDALYIEYNRKILERDGIVYTDREVEELKDYERAYIELGGGMKPIHIYSSMDFKKQVHVNHVTIEDPKLPYLTYDDKVKHKSKVMIMPLNQKQFEYYRNVFIAKDKVRIFGTGDGFSILVNGKVCGFMSFKPLPSGDTMMLLSDFAIDGTGYDRLSKLPIMIARCSDIRDILEIKYKRLFRKLITKVYTKKPVSMKYRGEWKKTKRDEDVITYETVFGEKTLKEEWRLWVSKHSTK